MLDRLISGAGALTDRADRFARVFSRRAAGDLLRGRPGSVAVAAVLVILAGLFAVAGLEATDDTTPRTLAPGVGDSDAFGNRTYATLSGGVAGDYVNTFDDLNANGTQDPGETDLGWSYFVVDPATRAGVTVRSSRPPNEVLRRETSGRVLEDADYISQDAAYFADTLAALGLTLDDRRLLDATTPGGSSPPSIDLAAGLPEDGTLVTVAGAAADWFPFCMTDSDRNGTCEEAEFDAYDVLVYDEVSKRGIVVWTLESPEFTPATFTGLLRRDERGASEAMETQGLEFDELDLDISARYVLDDGAAPTSAPFAFALAALCGLVAGVILIGLAGGYLIFRRGDAPVPAPATTLTTGERIPLKVTGVLRATDGSVHVREAPADLVRFQTTHAAGSDAAASVGSTLIIERRGRPEGVAVGLGELQGLTSGTVLPLGGERPALRVVAGTGPLLLSFDTAAERDRAASELLDETGLGGGPTPSDRVKTHTTEET